MALDKKEGYRELILIIFKINKLILKFLKYTNKKTNILIKIKK